MFQLTVTDILNLKEAKVSDEVITFMINSGKYAASEEQPSEFDQGLDKAQESLDYEVPETTGYDTSSSFNFSVGLGFGTYYYPSWPGYAWGCYYDPFSWVGWGGYYAWCTPYPYWRSYSCWYPSYNRCYGYWGGGGYYGGVYVDSYGRDVGSRGPVARTGRSRGADQAIADGNTTRRPRTGSRTPGVQNSRRPQRNFQPRDPNVQVARQTPRPSYQPKRPSNPVSRQKVQKPRPKLNNRPPRATNSPVRGTTVKKPTRTSAQQKRPTGKVTRSKQPSRATKVQRNQPRPAKVSKPTPKQSRPKVTPKPTRAPSSRPAVKSAPSRSGGSRSGVSRGSSRGSSRGTSRRGGK